METKHLRGLSSTLNKQIKQRKREGGPTKALRMAKTRPERRRDGICFIGEGAPEFQPTEKWNWKPKKTS